MSAEVRNISLPNSLTQPSLLELGICDLGSCPGNVANALRFEGRLWDLDLADCRERKGLEANGQFSTLLLDPVHLGKICKRGQNGRRSSQRDADST